MNNIPKIKLNNGVEIPAIGIGPGIIESRYKTVLNRNSFWGKVEYKLGHKLSYIHSKNKYIKSVSSAFELGYRLFVNGGSIVAIGGRHSMPEMQSRQASVIWRLGNVEADKIYSIDNVCSYKSLRAYQMGGASLFFSSPKLKKGSSYSLSIDGEEKEKIESLKSPFVNVGRTGWPF